MTRINLQFTVNGMLRSIETDPCRPLLSVLRKDLGLTSVKEGCGQGDCGSCVVVIDGLAVNACLVLAGQVEGTRVMTLEGLGDGGNLHPLQRHFAEKWAFQCGFCTPGMIMSCYALLLHNPNPAPQEIREAISGNLCRCTSYQNVVNAVQAAANELGSRAINEGVLGG